MWQAAVLTMGLVVTAIGVMLIAVLQVRRSNEQPAIVELFGFASIKAPGSIVITTLGVVMTLVAATNPIGLLPGTNGSPDAGGPTSIMPRTVTRTPTSTHSQAPSPTTPPPLLPAFTILTPRDGQEINGQTGTIVSGTAGNLNGATLWLFDISVDSEKVVTYVRDSDNPIPVVAGKWSLPDKPIGDGAIDIGKTAQLSVVEADATCTQTIQAAQPNNDGDVILSKLGSGCTEHRVSVKIASW
jgi:hypothetical protein